MHPMSEAALRRMLRVASLRAQRTGKVWYVYVVDEYITLTVDPRVPRTALCYRALGNGVIDTIAPVRAHETH